MPGSLASPAYRQEADISFFSRLLFAVYFLEAGFVLIMAPWSVFWERNILAGMMPGIERVAASAFARGAVTGVGAVTAIAGLVELAGIFRARGGRQPQPGRNVEA